MDGQQSPGCSRPVAKPDEAAHVGKGEAREEAGLLLGAPPPGGAAPPAAAVACRAPLPLSLLVGVLLAGPVLQGLIRGQPVEAVCLLASRAQPGG